jgi:hypothetical protein
VQPVELHAVRLFTADQSLIEMRCLARVAHETRYLPPCADRCAISFTFARFSSPIRESTSIIIVMKHLAVGVDQERALSNHLTSYTTRLSAGSRLA